METIFLLFLVILGSVGIGLNARTGLAFTATAGVALVVVEYIYSRYLCKVQPNFVEVLLFHDTHCNPLLLVLGYAFCGATLIKFIRGRFKQKKP
jgi:hypothetical protein